MKRYSIINGMMVEDENGDLVLYEDHLQKLKTIREELDSMAQDPGRIRDSYERNTMSRYD